MGDCVPRDILFNSGPLSFMWFVNEIAEIFEYVRVLFNVDDMKLFLPVRGFQLCLKFQDDLNRLGKTGRTHWS
jgi:hypothetical protein